MRLPESRHVFSGLSGLSPSKLLSQTARFPFEQLPMQHLMAENLDELENQYRRILLHPWVEEEIFAAGIPKDTETFWSKIFSFEGGEGIFPYRPLAKYALSCLTMPISNAFVERIFSHVTYVKNKQRNRMSTGVLKAIIRIRTSLVLKGKCCQDLVISNEMLKRFNTRTMYGAEAGDGGDGDGGDENGGVEDGGNVGGGDEDEDSEDEDIGDEDVQMVDVLDDE